MLIYENLWDVITGDQPAETETTKFATWKKSNDKARARIGLLVEDDQLLHIRNAKTEKERKLELVKGLPSKGDINK